MVFHVQKIMLCFLECLSQNNPRGQKTFLRAIINDFELSSIICSGFNMFGINVSP
jgi:hypothetical protein